MRKDHSTGGAGVLLCVFVTIATFCAWSFGTAVAELPWNQVANSFEIVADAY